MLDFEPRYSYSRIMEANGPSRGLSASAPGHLLRVAGAGLHEIDPRARLVLTAVIENYIANGEPVASQTIARQQHREGLSSATVRNVMAELCDSGYLDQPHTSAGRIPTAQGFRFYVEQLLRRLAVPRQGVVQRLPQPAQEQLEETFNGVVNASDFFARTSHVLALLSGGVGVAWTASGERELLEHVHFTRLGRAKVVTVLVTTTGVVRDRVLMLDQDLSVRDLEAAANYLNTNFHGWSLERIRHELVHRIERDRSEYHGILCSLEELWSKTALEAREQDKSIFVDGAANLIVSEADRKHLQRILMALEEKQRIVELLNAYVDGKDAAVRVIIGLQDAMPEMRDLVLIAAPARLGHEHRGTVAVIGPTRMQYESTIGTVTYITDLFERCLGQS